MIEKRSLIIFMVQQVDYKTVEFYFGLILILMIQ